MTEKLKYKVGDRILFEAIISEVDVDDTDAPYYLNFKDDDTGLWVDEEGLRVLSDNLPPKPKVPQFVLDWCEAKRETGMIWNIARWLGTKDMPKAVSDWLFTGADLLLKQHALATLIAYGPKAVEVEREKRYTIKAKFTGQFLIKKGSFFLFGLANPLEDISEDEFTKQELIEAGFEGVFDNPMFEVEEVEL